MELKKLAPNFAVQDIEKTVAFYRDVLGFKLEMAVPEDKSGVEQELTEKKKYIYAMMSRNSVQVMFQRTDSIGEDVPPLKGVPIGASVSFYIEVEDINALYQEMKSKAEVVKELETVWYGMQEFYIKDCNGYILVSYQ
ncbi:MAG: VOC family protein [Candidatus Cloacimonetes bacterium]|nr:VOC family protein [Candidatus Cloacimonadota bacterium]